jgi:hypothetical protein
MQGGYGYIHTGDCGRRQVKVTHSALDSVIVDLNPAEVQSLAFVYGWSTDRAAEYLARVQIITRKGFTIETFAKQQNELLAIDREFGLVPGQQILEDQEFIQDLRHQVITGRIEWMDALNIWHERLVKREDRTFDLAKSHLPEGYNGNFKRGVKI